MEGCGGKGMMIKNCFGGTHFDCCSTNLSTLACMASAEGLCTSPRNVRMDFESASISLCDDLSSFDSSRNSCFKNKMRYIFYISIAK